MVFFGFVNIINAQNTANIKVLTNKNTFPVNDIVEVEIVTNSVGESVNGIEGKFIYNAEILNLEKIQIGDSFVSLWVEKPNVVSPGVISFSGIIPGGIVLTDSNIFSAVFSAKQNGSNSLTIEEVKLLINDGLGSILPVSVISTDINVSGTALAQKTLVDLKDYKKPVKFNIDRVRDESIFENKWFVAFSTQDKESGISHYEVCEGFKGSCSNGASPYLLQNQSGFYYIKVIAVDTAGNTQNSFLISTYYYVIAGLFLSLLFVFCFKYFRKKN